MLLRYLVSQYIRQAAQQTLQDAVETAAQQARSASNPERGNDEQPADDPPSRPEVVIFFALSVESGGLMDLLEDKRSLKCASFVLHHGRLAGRTVAIVETGVGQEATGRAVADALSALKPDWAISAGFAGSLNEELRRGHILMADEIASADGKQKFSVGLKMNDADVRATPGLHMGRLLTVDDLIARPEDKVRLGQTHKALACDMESLAVAQACQRSHVRMLSVRIISDGIEDQLPPEIDALLGQSSWASKAGAVAGAVWNRPSSMKDMWALQEQAIRASDRLAKFIVSMLPQLGP